MGNCCGYCPKCVNVDFCPDHEGLQTWCRESEISSDCGWPVISACVCNSGKCEAVQTTEPRRPLPEGATVIQEDPPFQDEGCNNSGKVYASELLRFWMCLTMPV